MKKEIFSNFSQYNGNQGKNQQNSTETITEMDKKSDIDNGPLRFFFIDF